MLFFLIFFLIEGAFLKEKIDLAFPDRAATVGRIAHDIIHQVSRYLSLKFLTSLVTAVAVLIGLKIVGLQFAIVWAFIQFALNFIPTLGSIAAGVLTTVFALLQFWPTPGPVVAVALIMLGINMFIGNVLEPKIMGDGLGLSPLAIFLSLAVWGYLWGFTGMVIAVPMTVIVKIVCDNIQLLEPIAILLDSHRSMIERKAAEEGDKDKE
jgi:predicted PurR-regulated permease PerM